MVYILEQEDGELVTLRGGAEPFVTQEDDNDDIFTPIRKQTGTLRIVDTDGSLMENLMPRNNVEKMVKLYTGTWDSTFTTFTDGEIKWQGFLCAQAYSQPAGNGVTELEFPVKSMLAALEDVPMDYSDAARVTRIGYLFAKASYGILNSSSQSPWSDFYFIEDIGDSTTVPAFVNTFMNWGVMFINVYTKNEGQVIEMPSYYDALSEAASLFGVQIRESGNRLLVGQYDLSEQCIIKKMTWAQIQRTGGTTLLSPAFTYVGVFSVNSSFLSGSKFILNRSRRDYLAGCNKYTVLLKLNDSKFQLMPGTSERSDAAPYQIPCIGTTILAQPHTSATGMNTEAYNYYNHSVSYEWREAVGSYWVLHWTGGTASTFQDFVIQSVMMPAGRSRFINGARDSFTTGASPVRWSKGEVLSSALWLNLIPSTGVDTINEHNVVYTVTSAKEMPSGSGYINLSFNLNRFKLIDGNYIQWNRDIYDNLPLNLVFSLQIGNKYLTFNGTDNPRWVTDSNARCIVRVANGSIISNINIDYPGQGLRGGGIFARADGIAGIATLKIFNYSVGTRDTINDNQIFSFIMQNLLVSWVPAVNVTGTEEGENRYFKQENNGFRGDKKIDLIIGTYNANQPSASFVQKYDSGVYSNIEALPYRADDAGTTLNERPEEHLLNRVAQQNGSSRKSITYQTRDAVGDVMQTVFTDSNKKFFAVEASRNWRDDEQEVKFIEVE